MSSRGHIPEDITCFCNVCVALRNKNAQRDLQQLCIHAANPHFEASQEIWLNGEQERQKVIFKEQNNKNDDEEFVFWEEIVGNHEETFEQRIIDEVCIPECIETPEERSQRLSLVGRRNIDLLGLWSQLPSSHLGETASFFDLLGESEAQEAQALAGALTAQDANVPIGSPGVRSRAMFLRLFYRYHRAMGVSSAEAATISKELEAGFSKRCLSKKVYRNSCTNAVAQMRRKRESMIQYQKEEVQAGVGEEAWGSVG